MQTTEVPGFTLRKTAEQQYGRSKSSFIRDVDEAFQRDDKSFLSHFRVYLKDGSFIEGPLATKDKVQSVNSMQPRWYIETAFLDSRYWNAGKSGTDKSSSSKTVVDSESGAGDSSKASFPPIGDELVDSYRRQLSDKDQEIQFLRQQIKDQNQQLSSLSQRSQEDNVLLSKFQDLLDQSIRNGGLLATPQSSPTGKPTKTDRDTTSDVLDADVVESDKPSPLEKGSQRRKKSTIRNPVSKVKGQTAKKQSGFWTKHRSLSDFIPWKR